MSRVIAFGTAARRCRKRRERAIVDRCSGASRLFVANSAHYTTPLLPFCSFTSAICSLRSCFTSFHSFTVSWVVIRSPRLFPSRRCTLVGATDESFPLPRTNCRLPAPRRFTCNAWQIRKSRPGHRLQRHQLKLFCIWRH